eukprot:1464077-Rhodomonas_salina.4
MRAISAKGSEEEDRGTQVQGAWRKFGAVQRRDGCSSLKEEEKDWNQAVGRVFEIFFAERLRLVSAFTVFGFRIAESPTWTVRTGRLGIGGLGNRPLRAIQRL